jgi:hypothetical protein
MYLHVTKETSIFTLHLTTEQQIQIIKSLFIARTDTFAVRWEKNGKSGYAVALSYDMQE